MRFVQYNICNVVGSLATVSISLLCALAGPLIGQEIEPQRKEPEAVE